MVSRLFPANTVERQSLASNWQLCAASPSLILGPSQLDQLQGWLEVPVLGSVASVLRELGQWSLDAPPRRFDGEDWWYRLRFDMPEHKPKDNVVLGFDGLATLAEVWLNDELLFSSNNMFLYHQYPIGARLRAEGNELVIVCRSLDRHLTQSKFPRPRWRVPMLENQQLRWVRTTLLGRTPGWSPTVALVGPWRGIWLERRSSLALQTLTLRPTVVGSDGLLSISCGFDGLVADNCSIQHVELVLTRKNQQHAIGLIPVGEVQDGLFAAQLRIDSVELWWPHTHGEPALYQAQLLVKGAGLDQGITFDLGAIGFRTVHLSREPDNFSVHINGVPVFCRGACWTPLDPVTLDVSTERYSSAIVQLCEAGMNMVRVSGTMAYEADAFYTACAVQGVMVWQDFMFANMDYPDDAEFCAAVQQEVEQQLLRWQACPALAVLCGNSEVEQQAAMCGAPREYWSPALFHHVLADAAKKLCPDLPYWPSSAHEGVFPHQNDVGTTSYYGVGAYLRHPDDARRSKVAFATECLAFANVPEISNLQSLSSPSGLLRVHHPLWKERVPRDLGAGWDFEDVRDYYLKQCFGVDPLQLRYADHDRYLLLSKVVTGEVMAATFNEWRSSHSNCRGGLVLFLRDLWPGAGWGVVDSEGNPKAAYYYLKRTLQPLSLSISDEGNNGLFVHVTHESAEPITVEIDITLYKSGHKAVPLASRSLTLNLRDVSAYPMLTWFDQFMDLSYAYRFGPPITDAVHAQLRFPSGQVIGEAFYFPLGLTHRPEVELGLQAGVKFMANGDAIVTVQCARLALAVYFDVEGFVPEDNYFHLVPGALKTIKMRPTQTRRSLALFGYIGAINALEFVVIKAEV